MNSGRWMNSSNTALHSYPPYLFQILGFWVNFGVEMMPLHHGWDWQLPQTASHIYIRHIQSVWAHWYDVHRHKVVSSLTQLSTLLSSELGALIHLWGVKMMSLCHGWSWQPPQTASRIHVNHIQTVWAHWYAVHRHTVAAWHSYPPYLAQIWGLWFTYGESKWCHYVMVEADSHLKLLSASMLTIYKLFEHIDMLSIGIG
jgi:hypothetical protein